MNFEQILEQYNFNFPTSAIAQEPASPRDSAKILVYDRMSHEIIHDTFLNLVDHIPNNAVIVFNHTKVIPARLSLKKPTGGKVIILYLEALKDTIKVLSDRKLNIGETLKLNSKTSFKITKQDGQYYFLKPSFDIKKIHSILEKYGDVPIPPYIKHSPLTQSELKDKYQTVFAKQKGSVAAPTASLHFSKRLLAKLKKRNVTMAYVTLHVNQGTFATLKEENLQTGKLHSEWYEIDAKTQALLNKAKKDKRPIIAVGTTVVRTLESASNSANKISKPTGTTNLFIKPGYKFKFVDQIITNFHVPKSSLLMLVATFVGREQLLALYKNAISKKYKLFSFGDGMYIK